MGDETKRRTNDRTFYVAAVIGGAVIVATGAGLMAVAKAFWTQPTPIVIHTGPR